MKHKGVRKKILITGSSRGIGSQIARDAHELGFEVILHGRTKTESLEKLKRELDCDALIFDLEKWDSIEKEIKKLETLDVLVNCAGVNISAPFQEISLADWKTIYAVNVFGMAGVTRACLDMLENSNCARIVNIGSVKGQYSSVGRAAYASSKAAVSNLTSAMAKEFAPNILVNCIAPGFVDTDMTEGTMSPRIESQISSALLSRTASTQEISRAVMFFCGSDCSFITGQTLTVDGGFSIKKV